MSRPNNFLTAFKKRLRLSKFLVIPLFFVPYFAPLLSAQNTYAATDLGQDAPVEMYLAGRIYSEAVSCLYENYSDNDGDRDVVRRKITSSEATKFDIFTGSNGDSGDNTEPGHDIRSLVSSADDGVINCEDLEAGLRVAIPIIYEEEINFVKLFYTKEADGYKLKSKDEALKAASDILNSNFVASLDGGDAQKVRQAVAFAQCFDEGPDGMDPADSDTPNLSKAYVFLNDKDMDSEIHYGYTSFGPNWKYKCSVLLSDAERMDLPSYLDQYDITTGTLRNNPQNLYAAVADGVQADGKIIIARAKILGILTSNLDSVKFCEAAAGLSGMTLADTIEYLVTGDISNLFSVDSLGAQTPATDQQAATYKKCLLQDSPIGAELTATLEELEAGLAAIDNSSILTTTSGTAAGEADPCISSDAFMGWFVCPVIDIINGFTEKLRDAIEGALIFKLEDIGNSTDAYDAIKESWSIFRSLATILLIIGFLIALLAKTIKG